MALSIIDIDVRATWPMAIADFVMEQARRLEGTAKYTGDLNNTLLDLEQEFQLLLGGTLLRAYHCTRLLDHELDMIRRQGLRPLTPDLVRDKINAAHSVGAITQKEADDISKGHVFSTNEQKHREKKVCLLLSDNELVKAYGVRDLLSIWGGEGINFSSGTQDFDKRLRSFGRPAIVVALIDLSQPDSAHRVFPSLLKIFVGATLQLEDVGAGVHYFAPVPAKQITSIWQPGDFEYDRYKELPRR